jgi:cytochrome P450
MSESTDTSWKLEIRGRLPEEAEPPDHVPAELVMEPNYDDPNTFVDPFSATSGVFEDLPPVFYSPKPRTAVADGTWCVTRYEDIRNVYQNAKLYSTQGVAAFHWLIGETYPMIPLGIDPPAHGRYRSMLNPRFSREAVDQLEVFIRASINGLIDGFVDKGECDIAYDFGRIYPVKVFLNLMGFAEDMLEEFLSWEYAILHSKGDLEKVKWGIGNAVAWLREFANDVKANPGDNLASYIVHSEISGRPITDDEIMGTLTFLWVGGLDTVAATSALMFRRLALEPERQKELRDDPSLLYAAVEEFLRVQPLVNSPRLVLKDHEIRGVQLKQGDWVICMNNAGNFDPEEFPNPRELRFDRETNRHFTLAGGPHRCMGSHLARRELKIALGTILERLPPFEMKPDADLSVHPGLIAAPHVPIVWDPKASPN